MKLLGLWPRQGLASGNSNSFTTVQPQDPSRPGITPTPAPDVPNAAAGAGLATASSPSTTATPFIITTATVTTSPSASAKASNAPAPSHGLTQPQLIAAIAVPVGIVALIIPILVLWLLDRRRMKLAEKYASQQSMARNAKAWEPLPVVEKEYRGPTPARPRPAEPIPARKAVPERGLSDQAPQIPSSAISTTPQRSSLGLFNFEFSAPSSAPSQAPSPRWRLSLARALDMRRSEAAVSQVSERPSSVAVNRPPTNGSDPRQSQQISQPQIQVQPPDNHQSVVSATSLYEDPPPPYRNSRSPGDQAQERANRLSASHIVGQMNRQSNAADNQRLTYASSGVLNDEDAHNQRSRSPSPPSSEGRMSAHNNGPFTYDFPQRLSGVSQLSLDETQWDANGQRQSATSGVSAMDSRDSSTTHPHNII